MTRSMSKDENNGKNVFGDPSPRNLDGTHSISFGKDHNWGLKSQLQIGGDCFNSYRSISFRKQESEEPPTGENILDRLREEPEVEEDKAFNFTFSKSFIDFMKLKEKK